MVCWQVGVVCWQVGVVCWQRIHRWSWMNCVECDKLQRLELDRILVDRDNISRSWILHIWPTISLWFLICPNALCYDGYVILVSNNPLVICNKVIYIWKLMAAFNNKNDNQDFELLWKSPPKRTTSIWRERNATSSGADLPILALFPLFLF